ncbi:MAG: hypothetical protein Q7R74_01375, partial [bacterium]|nr:hypothetical protein [bacterium]
GVGAPRRGHSGKRYRAFSEPEDVYAADMNQCPVSSAQWLEEKWRRVSLGCLPPTVLYVV